MSDAFPWFSVCVKAACVSAELFLYLCRASRIVPSLLRSWISRTTTSDVTGSCSIVVGVSCPFSVCEVVSTACKKYATFTCVVWHLWRLERGIYEAGLGKCSSGLCSGECRLLQGNLSCLVHCVHCECCSLLWACTLRTSLNRGALMLPKCTLHWRISLGMC